MACTARRAYAGLFLLLFVCLGSLQNATAIPAFARKYGLPCSACHETWPKLNVFGQNFKDNGYQLMNDRDSPIWQNPSYWPVTFRITPNWHRESTDKVAIDTAIPGVQTEAKLMTHGFDLSGLDILTGGTLFQNISFLLTPSSDPTASFHFESAWVRFDNLLKSPWLNIKFGKFELDNIISEKRIENLSSIGGFYQLYHFEPMGDNNGFAQIGDNQLGMEWMGHSANDRTRVSAALFSSNDGQVNLPNGNSYSTYITASQAFSAGGYQGGVDRFGAYYYGGEAPTWYLTSGGVAIPGAGRGNASFHREGVFGIVYVKKLDFTLYYQHGWDSRYFATSTPGNAPLPFGARPATWNGGFVETHYTFNPQLIAIQRSEFVRMSQQAIPGTPSNQSNLDVYTFGLRWYPIMFSRAGVALHSEYALEHNLGTAPLTFTGVNSSAVFLGVDFDF